MSILTIANQAGSAGKTTTAVTLAALLARDGNSVRLIDLDGQANATYWLGIAPGEVAASSGDVLLRRATIAQAALPTGVPGLEVVPSTRDLDNDAVALSRELGGDQRLRLAIEAATPADVTIIDCPGALTVLTVAALVASDAVLTVAKPTVKEIAGIAPLQQTIADVAAAYNPKLALQGVVPTEVPPAKSGALYVDALALLADSYGELVTPPVRRSVRVPEAYSHQLPLPDHAPNEGVTNDYQAVREYLQKRGVL